MSPRPQKPTPSKSVKTKLRIAVTGASGILGKSVLQRLRAEYADVVAIGRTPVDGAFVQADLTQPRELAKVLKGVDVVVHCAGKISESGKLHENTRMAKALVGALKGTKTRVLNYSTAAVYGCVKGGMADEDTPCYPALAYSTNKLECEQILDELGNRLCHLRIGNVFNEAIFSSVLSSPFKRLLRGGEYSNLIFAEEVSHMAAHVLTLTSWPRCFNVNRDDLGPLPYAEIYAMRTGAARKEFYLHPWFSHAFRRVRGMQSVTANIRFSNARLMATGYTPLDFKKMMTAKP